MRKLTVYTITAILTFVVGLAAVLLSRSSSPPFPRKQVAANNKAQSKPLESAISREVVLMIAKEEAIKDHVSIDDYNIIVLEDTNQWRINFLLKDPLMSGGGPEYIVDKKTGEITGKKFYQ